MNTTSELTPGLINAATGRELDALWAIHGDGWTDVRFRVKPNTQFELYGVPHQEPGQPRPRRRVVPAYSTDGNAMLAVLEHLQKQSLNVRMFGGHADEWLVKIWMDPHLVESQSMSLPEAVCRASLLAVFVQKKAP